jgi:acetyl esterase/lipase
LNAYEFFTALRRQGKPVELFYYPSGEHELDTPAERLASLRRNVDWFRFWMQGVEGSAPAYDRDQYKRWRELRALVLLHDKDSSPSERN